MTTTYLSIITLSQVVHILKYWVFVPKKIIRIAATKKKGASLPI